MSISEKTSENAKKQLESDEIEFRSPKLSLPELPSGQSYSYQTTIKPVGAQCNLDCAYCFYLHKENLLTQPKRPRMSDQVLEQHIKQTIEANTGDQVEFTWQGGEPALAGLSFYQKVVKLQQKYKKNNQQILNSFQTNGTFLNDEWCQFLAEHNFLVGISIDGPQALHDQYRRTKNGNPSHQNVMKSVELLHHYQVDFNVLCVVNRQNSQHPLEVYRFLRDEVKAHLIQFIPGVEPIQFDSVAPSFSQTQKTQSSKAQRTATEWSVGASAWGKFLSCIWDEWFESDFGQVYIDQFENVISIMLGYGSQKCVTSQFCGHSVALEFNGDVYSCDHFVYPEYKLGNIFDTHEGNLIFSDRQMDFGINKMKALPQFCQKCLFLKMCWGECPRNRFIATPDGESGLNYLCDGLQIFYRKAVSNYQKIT